MVFNKNIVTVDLRTSTLLGPSCKFFESLKYLSDRGYDVLIIGKKWGDNIEKGQESPVLWDPYKHPEDIIVNLILPTFENVKYVKTKKYSIVDKLRVFVPPFFSKYRIVHYDFVMLNMEAHQLVKYKEQQLAYVEGVVSAVRYLLFYGYCMLFRHFTIKPESIGFRYSLSAEKKTKHLNDFISMHKSKDVKYILISVLWDEGMKFEIKPDRLKGGPGCDMEKFEDLKRYVKELDNFALKTGKIKFILASKKAVDWENFIESDFVDLRYYEDMGFSMSQMIYISQELSSATINWPSTFSIWITNCSGIVHLTWMNNKDTAKWTRNNLHEKGIGSLLSKIDVR